MSNNKNLIYDTIKTCKEENENRCYSPTQNLEIAYIEGSEGCTCNEQTDEDICVKDKNGESVALICSNGKWSAVIDGPCMPELN